MTWTLTTSGNAVLKAGLHANSDITTSGSPLLAWCTDSEGYICEATGIDWVTNYSTASTQVKNALSEAVSSHIALKIISYDTSNYISNEADILLNINDGMVEAMINKLKEVGKSNNLKSP